MGQTVQLLLELFGMEPRSEMLQLRPPKEEREAISRDDPVPSVVSTVAAEPVGPPVAVPSEPYLHGVET
jgi:hypothetical protein